MRIEDLDTPAVVIDLDRVEGNISRLQHYLDAHGIANRPHVKTHKIPYLAHRQLEAGAIGITCQKIGEAEVMAQAGIRDLFLPYNILGKAKLERLAALARWTNLSVTADSATVVEGLSGRFRSEAEPLTVLIECDTGGGRCGVQTPEQAVALARLIERSPGLRFGGLMTYPCGDGTDPFMARTRELLAADRISLERVSGGSTPRMWQAHTFREVNEYRAGTYIYGDRKCIQVGAMTPEQCAMTIITTVVSRPIDGRAILDGGSKTFTSDTLGLEGHGMILEYPEARFYSMSEEHGHVDVSACEKKPAIGERVSVIPNHCCVVSNMVNEVVGVRNGEVEAVWPIAARGRLQ